MAKKQVKKSPKPKARKERPAEAKNPAPSEPAQPEGKRKETPKRTGRRGIGPLDTEAVSTLNSSEGSNGGTGEQRGEALFPETPTKRKPRQPRLPQMEDAEIEEIEGSAENYADIRDQRMELTKEETRLKTELLGLMKKYGKTSYVHDGYDVKVIVESEKLKVRIRKEE